MTGYTIVLIDNVDGSEGDFVHVESFETFEDLLEAPDGTYPEWVDRLMAAAGAIEERDADDRDS